MPSRSPQPVPPNGILPSAKQAQAVERRYGDQAIVASTGHSPHPYSSISLSPDRRYAITACKDILQLLQIRPTGLVVLKSIPMAAHFSTSNTSASRFTEDNKRDSFVDAFLGSDKQSTQMSVVITDVSWSAAFSDKNQTSSYIACAGSNGVIIVWNAMALLEGSTASPNTKSEGATRQVSGSVTAVSPPEAVLSQHIRAVNRLAWHPIRPGLLLSASQDATVLLWERRKVSSTSTLKPQVAAPRLRMLFGGGASNLSQTRYSWHGRARYEPRSEAIRDIKWSPHYEDGKWQTEGHGVDSSGSHGNGAFSLWCSICSRHFYWLANSVQSSCASSSHGQNVGSFGRLHDSGLAPDLDKRCGNGRSFRSVG